MPRRSRVFVEGGIYHVYNRFARGAEMFSEPEEAVEFIAILRKASHRDDLRVYAWALMFNHQHMAVRASQIPLSSRARYLIAAVGIERWNVNANLMARLPRRWPGAVSHWAKGVGAMME